MTQAMQNQMPAAAKSKTIEIEGLNFFYGKTQSLKNVSLDIHDKQVTAFIGPSGTKSCCPGPSN